MCEQTKKVLHLANLLLNLQSVVRTNLLTQTQSFYLLFLLTYKIQPHVNIKPTYIHITLSRRIYTHIQTKRITHYRLAFIRIYIQSYIHAFLAHI